MDTPQPDFRRIFTPLSARKPESWSACPFHRDLRAWQAEMLRQLPVIETRARPMDDFLGEQPPRECIVRVGARTFYVNPEGYSYARYAFEFDPSNLEPKNT